MAGCFGPLVMDCWSRMVVQAEKNCKKLRGLWDWVTGP